jgi:hypothetical protein
MGNRVNRESPTITPLWAFSGGSVKNGGKIEGRHILAPTVIAKISTFRFPLTSHPVRYIFAAAIEHKRRIHNNDKFYSIEETSLSMSGANLACRVLARTIGYHVKLPISLLQQLLETISRMRWTSGSLLRNLRCVCAAVPDCMPSMPCPVRRGSHPALLY